MGNYDDIINLPHHVSTKHPRMSATDRAAQFSPFAALTGHEAAIAETARLTDARPVLDESRKMELNDRLQVILGHISLNPEIAVTYFVLRSDYFFPLLWRLPPGSFPSKWRFFHIFSLRTGSLPESHVLFSAFPHPLFSVYPAHHNL